MAWTIRQDLPTHTAGGNTCYICRTDPRRDMRTGLLEPMMDPNIHIEFEGYLIICSTCIKEGATQLGMLSEKQQEHMNEQLARLGDKLDETEIRARMAEDALDALRRYELVKTKKEVQHADPLPEPSVPEFTLDAGVEGEDLGEGAGTPSRRSFSSRRR